MSITDFLAKIFPVADRLDAAASKIEADHKVALEAKDREIAELSAKLDAAPSAESLKAAEDLAAKEKARAEKAEADLKAEQDALPGKINAEVAKVVAGNGHSPVETVNKTEQKAGNPGEGLTGLAKSIAIHKAQNSKK